MRLKTNKNILKWKTFKEIHKPIVQRFQGKSHAICERKGLEYYMQIVI